MATGRSRRDFLADVGRGVLVASVGAGLAQELGLSAAYAGPDAPESLSFGDLEPLVCLMQETPAAQLLPALVAQLKSGVGLNTLLKAAALANARTFGGEDYVGFHTMMALAPAWHMATELPEAQRPLPVFKVLYRNTNRIQEHGGRKDEVLHPVEGAGATDAGGEALRAAVRRKDVEAAERLFAQQAAISDEQAFNDLLYTVQDTPEVHRVVLPYRAWDLLGLIGREQAHTMLRQSVRYCVQAESYNRSTDLDEARTVLPKMLEQHGLLGRSPGERIAEDSWIEAFSQLIFRADPEQAAGAAAAALAEGIRPADVGEAISLAANQLVLRDEGRPLPQEQPGKPVGS